MSVLVAYMTVLIRNIQERFVMSGYQVSYRCDKLFYKLIGSVSVITSFSQHKKKKKFLEVLVKRRKNVLLELRKYRFDRYALVMEVLDLK